MSTDPHIATGRMTFAGFEARVLAQTKQAWRELVIPPDHPDPFQADPQPMLYAYADEQLMSTPIPEPWFSSRDSKDTLALLVAVFARKADASMVAMCTTTMGMSQEQVGELTDEDSARLEQHLMPDRLLRGYDNLTDLKRAHPDLVTEAAQVVLIDREVAIAHMAEVIRKGHRVRLGAWERIPMVTGMMVDPIQAALR